MKRNDLLILKIEEALKYLYTQEEKLKPFLENLEKIINKKMSEEELSLKEAFTMYTSILDQYTNSILLITKIKEILEFKD